MVAADAFCKMNCNVLGVIKRIFSLRKYREGVTATRPLECGLLDPVVC
jgi:hypothetical protein